MNEENNNNLSRLVQIYCYGIIEGFERGYYIRYNKIIKSSRLKQSMMNANITYHNKAYKALILENDTYFIKQYSTMKNASTHSYICLLNLTFMLCSLIIENVNREILDDTHIENYITSLFIQITNIFQKIDIIKLLDHKCDNIDIKLLYPTDYFTKNK